MVDFSKRLSKAKREKPIDPIEIYDGLDRASDKGELRRAQAFVLKQWHATARDKRDVIIKLHTGQGKTVMGLLLLQSKLNEKGGPVVYFCPNIQLIEQTCEQARQFGFSICKAEAGQPLPSDFIDGKAILVTSIQKLFNGLTRFGLHHRSLKISAFVMDDSHACVDAIREAVTLSINRTFLNSKGEKIGIHPIYEKVFSIFSDALREQGEGTFQDIQSEKQNAFLAVPYWAWTDKAPEVTKIVGDLSDHDSVKFVWPIIKDRIADCLCVISGTGLEVTPNLAPLEDFGSFWKADTRIFMSATVTDDSFLVKGLRLAPETISNPLTYPGETWSGEKMILIPSLIDDGLGRSEIVNEFGRPGARRSFGIVSLCPSFKGTKDWEGCGAKVARRESIDELIRALRNGIRDDTIVFVNRYDGIDLPDDSCRILIFDSLPFGESLIDQYLQICRADSEVSKIRLARSIEQALGRSVRGEKDYSVIIVIGTELVNNLRQAATRAYLSDQTRHQVEIGIDVSEYAKEDIKGGKNPMIAFRELVQQCLKRDQGWKDFYVEKMNQLKPEVVKSRGLALFEKELSAETEFHFGSVEKAIKTLQELADDKSVSDAEKGFYLQEMARYKYRQSKIESNKLQQSAHRRNRFLFKPRDGFVVERLEPVAGKRVAAIANWVKQFDSFERLKLAVDEILDKLAFGVRADDFEAAVRRLGTALGFASERPDKEWKQGPDNLWCLQDGDYLLIECKNEVAASRAEIYKDETGQMNNASAWFRATYPGCSSTRLMIIPTNKLGAGAVFSEAVGIVRKHELSKLAKNVRQFFNEFAIIDLAEVPEEKIHAFLVAHLLTTEAIKVEYQKDVYGGVVR